MNIIYLLENTSKTEGTRFYIGSKAECYLGSINGIPTIICNKTGKPYYSSSQNKLFKKDMKDGHTIVASVLEEVPNKRRLLEREEFYIQAYNAVKSDEYYNLSNARLDCHANDQIANIFGQTVKEVAKDNSTMSKRDGTARNCGFANFGEFYIHLYTQLKMGVSTHDLSASYGKHRKFVQVSLRNFDMEQALLDLHKEDMTPQVRLLVSQGASLKKAAELLGISYIVARKLLADFDTKNNRPFSVAAERGMTKEELEIEITKQILDGKDFRDVSKEMALCFESVKRYFFRCIRRHLKPADLGVQCGNRS